LSAEALERVFERFYREDAARTRNVSNGGSGGSGLGLSIAKALVESHEGRLTAANHADGGAVFSLHLPPQDHLQTAGKAKAAEVH
jgi:signal transduction histidine kinase